MAKNLSSSSPHKEEKMLKDTQINDSRITVTLRESLLDLFREQVRRDLESLNCAYFVHNLIKNYCQKGHTVSSFHTHPEWQQEYWQDHWDSDLLARKIHDVAETDGFAISSWDFVDPDSGIMKRRKSVCHLDDGVHFTFKHEDGMLENYSFGWKNVKGQPMGFEKLLKLSDVVDEFRDAHLKLFCESNPGSSGARQ